MLNLPLLLLLPLQLCGAQMELKDNGAAITLKEGGKPVFVYHYGMVEPPQGVKAEQKRGCYIHPLHGLDGEVLTQDFPFDHRHHRGVFWAWPDSTVGGEKIDIWALDGVRQHHEKWVRQETSEDIAILEVQNLWLFDDRQDTPQVREFVTITTHPAKGDTRAIDFDLRFHNISGKELILRGAVTDNKGYGGFSFRPDATRRPMQFTTATGKHGEDVLENASPWADLSNPMERGAKELSGVAIFQHPENPGYPHPGWMLRHYGFLGVSWPHTTPHTLAPEEEVRLRYRLLVHRSSAEYANVEAAFSDWLEACAAE